MTGVWQRLAGWTPQRRPDSDEVERTLEEAAAFAGPELPGPFEVVASVCLLSQLIEAIVTQLGEDHPQFLEFVQVVRRRHLQLLVELTASRGRGWLVTDVVSTATAPELGSVPERQLAGALA